MMQIQRRGPWSANEDAMLVELVKAHGAHNWVRISALIASRTPKQCRERFHQNLKPTLNHDPITPEEGALIDRLVGEMGKRWAEIARRLNGRSDNAVKNWWNGGMNRKKRMLGRQRNGRRAARNHMQSPPSSFSASSSSVSSPISKSSHITLSSSSSSCSSSSSSFPSVSECSTATTRSSSITSSSSSPPPQQRTRGLEIFIRGAQNRHNLMDESLVSPTYSQISEYSHSRVRTPSLVSDTTSTFSVSPRVPSSPTFFANMLPPLIGQRHSQLQQQQKYQQYAQYQPPLLSEEVRYDGRYSVDVASHAMMDDSSSRSSCFHERERGGKTHEQEGDKMSLGFVCL